MEKVSFFKNIHLSQQKMREFDEFLTRPGGIFHRQRCKTVFRLVYPRTVRLELDTSAQFLAAYDPSLWACYERHFGDVSVIMVNFQGKDPESKLIVKAPDRETVDRVVAMMDDLLMQSAKPPETPPARKPFCRNPLRAWSWRKKWRLWFDFSQR